MTLFQTIVVPALVLVSVLVFVETARRAVPWRTGLLWTGVWLTAAMFVAFPTATVVLAKWLGIGRGADLVLYAAAVAGLGVSLYFYGRYRRLEELLTGVIRREALRDARRGHAERGEREAAAMRDTSK